MLTYQHFLTFQKQPEIDGAKSCLQGGIGTIVNFNLVTGIIISRLQVT